MLTFEHFFDRPTWAAAAGYDFNIIDCMSEAASRFKILPAIAIVMKNIPDIELRNVWWELPTNLLAILMLISWPLTFWIAGGITYRNCRQAKRKYYHSDDKTVQANLNGWLRDFEWQRSREMSR